MRHLRQYTSLRQHWVLGARHSARCWEDEGISSRGSPLPESPGATTPEPRAAITEARTPQSLCSATREACALQLTTRGSLSRPAKTQRSQKMKGGRFCAPSDGDALPSYQTVLRKAPATLQCGLLPTDRLHQERDARLHCTPGSRGHAWINGISGCGQERGGCSMGKAVTAAWADST